MILSHIHKVLNNTNQPSCQYHLISVQLHISSCFSDVVNLARPPLYSSFKVNNRSFRYAKSCLWKELPKRLRQPFDQQSLSLLSDFTDTGSISLLSSLSPSIDHRSFSLPLRAQNLPFR